jgi:hypothetical protein
MSKLTKAQLSILWLMESKGGDLANFDEASPQWRVEHGHGVNNKAATALSKTNAVQYYRHEGGQPGVLFFRITDAGRAALASLPTAGDGKGGVE